MLKRAGEWVVDCGVLVFLACVGVGWAVAVDTAVEQPGTATITTLPLASMVLGGTVLAAVVVGRTDSRP